MVPASLGMSKYYEYVLKSIRGMRLVTSTTEDIEEEPTDRNLEQIEKDLWGNQYNETELEELLEETSEFLKKHTYTIH